jgi:hypothetical protein
MRRLVIPITLAIAALLAASLANGELTQRGNLRLAFSGKIAPKKLPRTGNAPVSMRVSGSIGTADGGRPPQLSKIAIAFNRYGHVSTRGLPICDSSALEQTTTSGARRICRGSLVGHGTFKADVAIPGRVPVPVIGEMLAFNSSKEGHPALLLHIYVPKPVQVTFILPFKIVRLKSGTFGTLFVARIPAIAAQLGYVTDVALTFERRYAYHGRTRSFLSARCAAPAGFPGAVFTLARGSFTFSNGQRISTALARNCWVR